MSLFKRLFGGPTTWTIRSLDDLVESRPVSSGSMAWSQSAPSDLATGGGVAAVVVDKKVLVTLDAGGTVLSTFRHHEKPITAIAVDARGEWVASAEENATRIVVRATRDDQTGMMFDTSAPVSALAFGPSTLYAGMRNGVIEAHPLTDWTSREVLRYQFAAKFFKEVPRVSWIDVSSSGDRIALIIGGVLFVWNGTRDGAVEATMEEKIDFMAARFSPDGRHLAVAGGHRDITIAFGDSSMTTTFKDPRGVLYLRDLERNKSAQARGEGYWIQNVLWSASGERLLCFPSVAPQETGPWTKAIAFHRTESVRDGSSVPESVTSLPTSVDTGSAGIIAPGQLVMLAKESGGIGRWNVGEEFAPPSSMAQSTPPPPRPSEARCTAEPTLDAIVVVFSRDFPTSGQFVDEILSQLTTRGRTYRSWMRSDTPVRVKIHGNAQDQMTVAAMALIEFRKLGVEGADLKRVQFGTFEGSQGIVGSVLSHWS